MEYVAPDTLQDVWRALDFDGAQCLAGGQSLIAMMNLGLATPSRLVSLRRIAELRGIARAPDGTVRIGAMTTHAELAALDERGSAGLLSRAARVVAYPAVRNRGTLGGAVALADPAADYPVVLTALDATIEIASAHGARDVPARGFFRGMFDTALAPGEIVAAVRLHSLPSVAGTAYEKLAIVAGDYAIVSVAAVATTNGTAHAAIGGYGMKPIVIAGIERSVEPEQFASHMLERLPDPPADHRASSAYRRRVAPRLVARAVAHALDASLAGANEPRNAGKST
jgi:carbon-monoxide dehydrogenase medium subunit